MNSINADAAPVILTMLSNDAISKIQFSYSHIGYGLYVYTVLKYMLHCDAMLFSYSAELLTDNICLASKNGVLKLIRNYRKLIIRCPVHCYGVIGCRAELLSDTWRTGCWNNNDGGKKQQQRFCLNLIFTRRKATQDEIRHFSLEKKKKNLFILYDTGVIFWLDRNKLKMIGLLSVK